AAEQQRGRRRQRDRRRGHRHRAGSEGTTDRPPRGASVDRGVQAGERGAVQADVEELVRIRSTLEELEAVVHAGSEVVEGSHAAGATGQGRNRGADIVQVVVARAQRHVVREQAQRQRGDRR
ncbi:MAG: hypothetical protein ACK559_04430, partial [bacterium]